MKILLLFLASVCGAYAQRASGVVVVFSAPSGACPSTSPMRYYSNMNAYYGCVLPSQISLTGVWTLVVGGGGAPTGPAGGDLGGTYPNPTVTNGSHVTNSSIPNSGLVNPSTTVNGTTCTLGSSCTPSTAPSGAAGGDLSGTYPNPTVAKVNGGTPGNTCTNQFTRSISTSAVGTCATVVNTDLASPSTTVNGTTCTLGSTCTVTGAPSGSAGGDLSGTYPNPTVAKVNGNTPGNTCTNQLTRSIDSSARGTCATVQNADMANVSITVNSTTCTLGSSCSPGAGPTGSAGGDLSGTYPNPTVAKVNGGTPGNTCTNQFTRSISTSAVGTCATVDNASLANASTTVDGQTCTLGSSCTTVAKSAFMGNSAGQTVAAGATFFLTVTSSQNSGNEVAAQYLIPYAATATIFYLVTSTTQSAGGAFVCTVRIASGGTGAGSNSTLSISIPASTAAGRFTDSHNASFAAGDALSIGCVNNGSGTSAAVRGWGIGLQM